MFNRSLSVTLFATLLLVLTATGCSQTAEERFSNAKALQQQGKLKEAILDVKSALQEEPSNGAMRFLLGQLYSSTFDGASAVKELRLALSLGVTQDGLVGVELARALLTQEAYEDILKDIAPKDADKSEYRASTLALRGQAFHALGKLDEASKSLQGAMELQEGNPDAQMLKAQMAAEKGDLEGALIVLKNATSAHPNWIVGWSYQATLLQALGRDDETLVSYQKVLNLNPGDPRALLGVSRIFLFKGELDKADQNAQQLTKLYPAFPTGLAQLGVIKLARGEAREALDLALKALKTEPELPQGILLAAHAHLALGSLIQAEPLLVRYVYRFPKDYFARRALTKVFLHSGRVRQALMTIQPELVSDKPEPEAFSLAAEAFYRSGDTTKALELFGRATAATPKDPNIRARQALVKLDSGDVDNGLAELESAVALTKTATSSDEVLVMALIAQGDVQRAEKVVDALEKRAPKHRITLNLKGIVLLAKNDSVEAAKAFEAALAVAPLDIAAAGNLTQIDLYAGMPERARERYTKMLDREPRFLPALMALAQLETGLRDNVAAASVYERAVVAVPDALEPRLKLVDIYLALGKLKESAASAKETLIRFPKSAQAVALAARAELANGNIPQAVETISRLIDLNPHSASSAIQVARFQIGAGLPKDAEKTLQSALERLPNSYQLKLVISATLIGEKRFDEARSFALEVQKKLPGQPLGLMLEGDVYAAQGRYEQARKVYLKLIKTQPAGVFAKRIYLARRDGGDPKGALEELKQWVGAYSEDQVARQLLADILNESGDYKSAIAHYETLLERNAPQKPIILNNLAWGYYRTNDERAITTAEAALREAPLNGSVQDTLGWILLERGGDVDRALGLLTSAARTMPNSPIVRYHLAAGLVKKGDADAARTELKNLLGAVSEFPTRAEAQALLDSL